MADTPTPTHPARGEDLTVLTAERGGLQAMVLAYAEERAPDGMERLAADRDMWLARAEKAEAALAAMTDAVKHANHMQRVTADQLSAVQREWGARIAGLEEALRRIEHKARFGVGAPRDELVSDLSGIEIVASAALAASPSPAAAEAEDGDRNEITVGNLALWVTPAGNVRLHQEHRTDLLPEEVDRLLVWFALNGFGPSLSSGPTVAELVAGLEREVSYWSWRREDLLKDNVWSPAIYLEQVVQRLSALLARTKEGAR